MNPPHRAAQGRRPRRGVFNGLLCRGDEHLLPRSREVGGNGKVAGVGPLNVIVDFGYRGKPHGSVPPGRAHIGHGAVGPLDDRKAIHHIGAHALTERLCHALRARSHTRAERGLSYVILGNLLVIVGCMRPGERLRRGNGSRLNNVCKKSRDGRLSGGLIRLFRLGDPAPGNSVLSGTEMLARGGSVEGALAARHESMAHDSGDKPRNDGSGYDADAETSRGAPEDLGDDLVNREGERGRRHHNARPNKACDDGRIPSRPHD